MILIWLFCCAYLLWKSLTKDYPKDDFLPTLRRLIKDYWELPKALGKILVALVKLPFGVFLMLSTRRLVVSERSLNHMVAYLKAELKDRKGLEQVDQIPDSVLLTIVYEALGRAAEKENDGRARSGEFFKQVDAAANNIVAAFAGAEDADPRIKNILIFNRVL
jgi:hypothetical protein